MTGPDARPNQGTMASATPSPARSEPPNGGRTLRRARETAGLSLTEAARETRISAKYLGALEEDATTETFPAPAYARFFMRTYAEYLGLDPDPLLQARDARFDEAEQASPDLERIPTPPSPSPRHLLGGLLVVLSVATLGVLGIAALRSQGVGPAAPPPAAIEASPAVPSPSPAAAPADDAEADEPAPPSPPRRGIRAVLVVTAPSWVEATADGEVRVNETLPEGRRVVLRARETLDLVLGNAGGVRLRVNDRVEPTGGSGEVVRASFEWRDGELHRA
jgi:cytoskeleton protein RodZ